MEVWILEAVAYIPETRIDYECTSRTVLGVFNTEEAANDARKRFHELWKEYIEEERDGQGPYSEIVDVENPEHWYEIGGPHLVLSATQTEKRDEKLRKELTPWF